MHLERRRAQSGLRITQMSRIRENAMFCAADIFDKWREKEQFDWQPPVGYCRR